MLATISVNSKGIRSAKLLLEAITNLLQFNGIEVSHSGEGEVVVGFDEQAIKNCMALNQTQAESPTKPEPAIAKAYKIVHGDREQTYGDAGKNLRTIAAYWNTHLLAAKSIEARLTEEDVCGMMILLKQARLASNPQHNDSLVDIAGYVELNDIVQQQKQQS